MFPVMIRGLGWSLPPQVVTSAELEQRLGIEPGWIERTTGVKQRHHADNGDTVALAADAARQALDRADLSPEKIQMVIGASTSRQQVIPCTAALVQRALGLPEGKSLCFDLEATCLSFPVALFTAAHFLAQGTCEHILLFSSEITRHMRSETERESSVLLGDAAAALVLSRVPEKSPCRLWHAKFETHSSGADLTACLGGGTLHHPNDPATTPEMNQFHMDGRGVFKMAARLLNPFIEQFLSEVGWRRADIDWVVPHQASGPGVDLLVKRCGFRRDQILRNLERRGNTVAAGMPLALAEAVEAGTVKRGQRLFLIGTGAGLTLGAVALTF